MSDVTYDDVRRLLLRGKGRVSGSDDDHARAYMMVETLLAGIKKTFLV